MPMAHVFVGLPIRGPMPACCRSNLVICMHSKMGNVAAVRWHWHLPLMRLSMPDASQPKSS